MPPKRKILAPGMKPIRGKVLVGPSLEFRKILPQVLVPSSRFPLDQRSAAEIQRARSAIEKSGVPFKVLDENVETTTGKASISTMHLAKGLEFRTVVVMACDDEIIPSQERIEAVGDDADLEEV